MLSFLYALAYIALKVKCRHCHISCCL